MKKKNKFINLKSIKNGIINLDGSYIKIFEIDPINFNLKSVREQYDILYQYKVFLKSCNFDMQIVVQSRRSNISPHLNNINDFYYKEKSEKVKEMMSDYTNLVKDMSSKKKSISRRFFLITKYIPPADIKLDEINIEEVREDFTNKFLKVKQGLAKCGNSVRELDENEIINLLYTYLNKKTSVLQDLNGKLMEYLREV